MPDQVEPSPVSDTVSGAEAEVEKIGFFERLKRGLSKTHESFIGRMDTLVLGKKKIDVDTLEELEEVLITADIGVTTAVELIRALEQRLKRNELRDASPKEALKEEMSRPFAATDVMILERLPLRIMVIGVNGVGKTIPSQTWPAVRAEGKRVLLGAGDTFGRGFKQLQIGERPGCRRHPAS